MFKPEGVHVAMLTPFNDDGSVNEEELKNMIEFQLQNGVDGFFPNSSVGEFVHMSLEQRKNLNKIVAEYVGDRAAVTAGISATSAEQSLELGRHAVENTSCDAVISCTPYFYDVSQEIVERHFEVLEENLDLPLILYNMPLTTTEISYNVVKRLSRRKGVVGLKDSSGSMVDFCHYIDKVRVIGELDNMNFLTGREEILFATLMVGGKGCMSASAGIIPEIISEIYSLWQRGDYETAKKRQYDIMLLVRAMMFHLPFPLGFKAALEVRGFEMGPRKQPLSNTEQYEYQKIKGRIERIIYKLLDEDEVKVDKSKMCAALVNF